MAISTSEILFLTVSDKIVNRTVCFGFVGHCCFLNTTIQVKHCGDFIIYRLPSTRKIASYARYCSTKIGWLKFVTYCIVYKESVDH